MKYLWLTTVLLGLIMGSAQAQSSRTSEFSIKGSLGVGVNNGQYTSGLGLLGTLNFQSSWSNPRFRGASGFTLGRFANLADDVDEGNYSLLGVHYTLSIDALKYRSLSFMVNPTAGLALYTGTLSGSREGQDEEYDFTKLYPYAGLQLGFRIAPENAVLAYEIIPLNFHLGPQAYQLGYPSLGVDLRIGSRERN